MKRRQSRRGEGECKSNDGMLRKKNAERNTEGVHWQITHVICDSGVIKERLHEEGNYLSLCARHKETLTFVTHGGGGE